MEGVTPVAETVNEFADLKGETLIKTPGSINGESFTLRDLADCSIFLLDYTSEVEVNNCTNCQIFIGPVDGPAIFENCSNCQVAVASRMFKANNCSRMSFGIFSANGPSLNGSTGIRIASWSGAYAGLIAHFAAANLDPNNNQWSKVYDATPSAEEEEPNFELIDAPSVPWEVPLDGAGPPENPVPGPDGSTYQPTATAAAALEADLNEALAPTPEDDAGNPFGAGVSENGNHPDSATAAAGYEYEPPATSDARDKLNTRLKAQASEESTKKSQLQASAAKYLEDFYARRNVVKEERIKQLQLERKNKGPAENGPEGANDWERVISMIDFNLTKPNASDLGRFKSVLFACKAKESGTA